MSSRPPHAPRPARLALLAALAAACFTDNGPPPGLSGGSTTDPEPTGSSGPPPAVCGNGAVEPGEPCDDGQLNGDYAACKDDCSLAVCGDGLVAPSEECDDGDREDDDACRNSCVRARCGDGVAQEGDDGEMCDDGNADETDACASTCLPTGCGDGVVQLNEACDHGAANADDAACTSACQLAACGDGLLGPGEACDKPDPMACTENCALPTCGDGIVDPGEVCDFGEQCTPRCLMNVCGDGYKSDDEACDDGNRVNGDGCTASCRLVVCGDGQRVEDEPCDDGNQTPLDGCHQCERDAYFVFVTEGKFTGELGGLAEADKRCQKEADANGLDGTYLAWLSDGMTPPAVRFEKSDKPYILPGTPAEIVAENWLALVSGALQRPIERTAAGEPIDPGTTCEATAALAWTHTKATGGPFKGAPCSGWLTNSGDAVAGLVHEAGLPWTEGCPAIACNKALRLYCVEQP